jgi:outer membrane protein
MLAKASLRRLILVTTALATAAGAAQPAAAEPGYDPFAAFGNTWQVGGIVFAMPRYEGSSSYRVVGLPFVAPVGLEGDGWVQVKGADDVRLRALRFNGFEIGPLAGYRGGRDEDDADRLEGMGDIDGGLVLGAFASYRTGPLALSVSYHHQVTGDETGGLVRLMGEYTFPTAPGVRLTAMLGTNYATEEYMDAYFGVSAIQEANSSLTFYQPEAGFKDVFVGGKASIDLTDRWTLHLLGRYSRLLGDAADSPVVETENQFYGGAALSYKFRWGR